MKAKRLSAQRAIKLLSEFYETGTPIEMEHSFGWDHSPEVLRQNERVYAYYDNQYVLGDKPVGEGSGHMEQVLVGFGVLEMNLRDARDTEAFLSCGVFPDHRRKGYWHKIMADLITKSKDLGADFCSRTVNKVNEEHYRRSMRESYSEGSGWAHAGDHWHPAPGYGYFVWLFDDAERKEAKEAAKENGDAATD